MTTPRHTPGPWSAMAPLPPSYDDHGYRLIANVSKNAAVYCQRDAVLKDEYGRKIQAQDEANARLIAAAPDLLKACKDALAKLDGCSDATEILAEAIDKAGGYKK